MKAANGARKIFLTVLTTLSVLGVGILYLINPGVLAGTPKPDYSLSETDDTVAQPTGTDTAHAEFTITMVPGAGGYVAPVVLSYSGLPKGVTNVQWSDTSATVNTSPDNRSIDLMFDVPSSLKVGTYNFTVTGKNANNGADSRDVKVTLGVAASSSSAAGFSLTLNPGQRTVQQGSPTSYGVQLLASSSFPASSNVTLTAKGLPGGATAAFSPGTVSKSSSASTLTLNTTAKTHAGVYHFTVEGTSGKTKYDVVAQLTVQAPAGSGFTLALSPTQQQVAAGGTTTFALGISRSSAFNAVPITLSITGLPQAATASFDVDNPTTGNAAVITISTSEIATPDGNFEFTVTGSATAPVYVATVKGHLVVNTPPGKTFGISGGAGELAMGDAAGPINLQLSNPNDKPILITSLVVSISKITVDPSKVSAESPSCTTADFAVTQYGGGYPIRVEKKATTSLSALGVPQPQWPSVGLANDTTRNQNACQNAKITLAYSGNAREAG